MEVTDMKYLVRYTYNRTGNQIPRACEEVYDFTNMVGFLRLIEADPEHYALVSVTVCK